MTYLFAGVITRTLEKNKPNHIVNNLLSLLAKRAIEDRRGFCLGVFHRVLCLREDFLQSEQTNKYFWGVDAMLWTRFRAGGDLTDLTSLKDEIDRHLPGEDDPLEFPLDLYAILCLSEVAKSIATPDCRVSSELIEYFHETAKGTFQALIYPGIITDEIQKKVDEHPQVKQENEFLDNLTDQCQGLDNFRSREEFESFLRNACKGDLWKALRDEAIKQGIHLKLKVASK